ncbi:putative membrane protein [Arthrobacter sp. CAN_A6]
MRFINKYRIPIVWLLVAAMVLSVGAGFFSTVL